jgi:hypothetical protein
MHASQAQAVIDAKTPPPRDCLLWQETGRKGERGAARAAPTLGASV